jgi:hypothetical protein
MSIVQKLTEGIVSRDLGKEGTALINKWEQTGLLEGIGDDTKRNTMARLLENQAKELLREASSMAAGGDVEGFAAVAFPLVRRVFGSLIANDLVSVQPMSLPSGLIFFLDFTFGGTLNTTTSRLGFSRGSSLYGGGVVGAQVTGGVDLTGLEGTAASGPYNLRNGYSSPTASAIAFGTLVASGTIGADGTVSEPDSDTGLIGGALATWGSTVFRGNLAALNRTLRWDPDLTSGSSYAVVEQDMSALGGSQLFNFDDLSAIAIDPNNTAGGDAAPGTGPVVVYRLSQLSASVTDPAAKSNTLVRLVIVGTSSASDVADIAATAAQLTFTAPLIDNFEGSDTNRQNNLGAVQAQTVWGLENNAEIPEIDIKVDSVAVTAETKKLKAKWTPELGQDLNAYHNLDAEVELTQILSEQIALEIDREILEDLVVGARAGTRYWSRKPGNFLDRDEGTAVTADFTGNVSEWYETLIETINDVSAQVHRKTLRGAANFVVCGPEVANLLEFTAGFRANVTADSDRGDAGAMKVGSLSKKFDVIVDPYFPRNLILVGRRGSSFLESGYVYAPYVPLQTTPTIFGVEDFVPRKGVMTRYAKKMVRPDMYGIVIVEDLI